MISDPCAWYRGDSSDLSAKTPSRTPAKATQQLIVIPDAEVQPIMVYVRMTPHPVVVTIRDHKDYIRVLFLLYHYYRVGGSS